VNVLLFDLATGGHHLEYAAHIARYLRRQGDDVTFATSASDGGSLRPEMDEFSRVFFIGGELPTTMVAGAWQILMARGVGKALRLAERERADLVHCLYLDRSELGILASSTFLARQIPLFGSLFWPHFVHGRDERTSALKRVYHAASAAAIVRMLRSGRMHTLFVHSNRTRSHLVRRLGATRVDERVVVVPDPAKAPPPMSRGEARRDLDLPPDAPILLFFGETRPDKGADLLLDAIAGGGAWTTVIAGESGAVGEAEAEACRRSLREPARLITRFGFVSDDDANRYFRAADAVVLPYRSSFKGTSGVLQRAAASGIPVIATDVGDVGPSVRQAGLGIVVRPGSPDALARALGSFLMHAGEPGEEALARARRYADANSWEVLGERMRRRYLEAVARTRTRRSAS